LTDNPYQAPEACPTAVGVLSGSRADLLSVARFQKGILICVLIYVIALLGLWFVPQLRPYLRVGMLAVGFVGAVYVFLLAMRVYGTGLGLLLGLLALLPFISLLVLLSVVGRATAILKENGIRVGLLGADLSSFDAS
jgi:hypothetical protein